MDTPAMTTYDLARQQAEGRSSEVSNALVRQKDVILSRMGACEDADQFLAVLEQLKFVSELWRELDYGYKAVELLGRLINLAGNRRWSAIDMRNIGCHRRPAQRRLWNVEVEALEAIIGEAHILRATCNER